MLNNNNRGVHDLVDWVSKESEKAGLCAKEFILNKDQKKKDLQAVIVGDNIRYVVPQLIDFNHLNKPLELSFRVSRKIEQGVFKVFQNNQLIKTKKAKYIAPAEMEMLTIDPKDLLDNSPITLMLEEVLS